MQEKKPFVYLFTSPNGYYIFDVNKNTIREICNRQKVGVTDYSSFLAQIRSKEILVTEYFSHS